MERDFVIKNKESGCDAVGVEVLELVDVGIPVGSGSEKIEVCGARF